MRATTADSSARWRLVATPAAWPAGVRELLAALARPRGAGGGGESSTARLARAESQIFAIVAQRLRARLGDPSHAAETAALVEAVAAHRLDPYSAADRLLD